MTDVKAVAMDMNASYNLVVKEMLPHVQIVYDRYHMQSQYGKEVLGAVRLQEARKHKAVAQELMATMGQESSEARQETKQLIKAERKQYSEIKKLRWTLLTNGETLSSNQTNHLQEVLENHSDLAVCYALKEEMV